MFRFNVTATCEKGHTQTLCLAGMTREYVETWAGLMDGTSPVYRVKPGPDSVIGKCGICRSPISCEVEQVPDVGEADIVREADGSVTVKAPPPVDRSARVLADGSPVTEDHRELRPDGQQKAYVVLSAEERAKGFVRPVRLKYTHVGKIQRFTNPDHPSGVTQEWEQRIGGCGVDTVMGLAIAETYARDPGFYSKTFCCGCGTHLPLEEFVWKGTMEQVGS